SWLLSRREEVSARWVSPVITSLTDSLERKVAIASSAAITATTSAAWRANPGVASSPWLRCPVSKRSTDRWASIDRGIYVQTARSAARSALAGSRRPAAPALDLDREDLAGVALARIALAQELDGAPRLRVLDVEHPPAAVCARPPERAPVVLVPVVDEQRDGRVLPHVGEPAQRPGPLRFGVDGAVDGVPGDDEGDRHEVGTAGRVGGGEAGDPGGGETGARLLPGHAGGLRPRQ